MNLQMYITPLLAAISFYLIPTIMGNALVRIKDFFFYRITKKVKNRSDENISYTIISNIRSFSYGALLIYFEALVIDDLVFRGVLDNQFTLYFIKTLLISLVLLGIISIILKLYFHLKTENKIKFGRKQIYNAFTFIFLLLISSVTYAVWRWDSGLQTTLNWDIYHHQTLARIIKEGTFNLFTSNLSDSFQFDGYSTMFHTLIAMAQSLFNVNVLEFWWFVEFFHLLATVLVSYALVNIITKSRWLGVVGGVFGAFIFESAVAFTSLFLIPQTLAAVVVIAFIAGIFYKQNQVSKETYEDGEADASFFTSFEDENPKSKVTVLSLDFFVFAAYILLNHVIIGSLGIFLVVFCSIFFYIGNKNKSDKFANILLGASFLLYILVPLIASQFDLNSINRGEAEFFNFAFDTKLYLFQGFYGYAHYVFLPLGYIYALKSKNTGYKLLLILSNGILSLVLGPIPYSFKLLTIGRYLVNTLLALGVWFLIKDFGKAVRAVLIVLLSTTLLIILIINVDDFKQVPAYKGISTHVTINELEAARFLEENYKNQNVLVVADPATMHILEGLSGINTPGGAYTSLHTRRILSDIYYKRDSEITPKMLSIRDTLVKREPETILFVISGRFREWELVPDRDKFGIHWNVWKPYDLSTQEREDYEFIYYLEEILGYREVYRNEGMIILEVVEQQ